MNNLLGASLTFFEFEFCNSRFGKTLFNLNSATADLEKPFLI
jgi:hypothetical protein